MPPLSDAEKAEKLKNYATNLFKARQEQEERLAKTKCERYDIKDFEAVCMLGYGGFGKVYKVRRGGEEMAVKVLDKSRFKDYHIAYLARERGFMFSMESVFTCKAPAKWRDRDAVYLYMELATYGDLRRLLTEWGSIPEPRLVQFMSQLVCGLEYIHACNIIYRDLKPGNILVFDGGRLKLSDFGLAIKAKPDLNDFVGTSEYCPPEMFMGEHYTDAIDWWALGVLMYELTTGKRPFSDKKTPREVIHENIKSGVQGIDELPLSTAAIDMMKRLLEKNPAKRIGTNRPGVLEIKHHEWFKDVDFHDVIFEDVQIEDLGLPPYPGKNRPIDPNMFKSSRHEEEDRRWHIWISF